MTKNKYRYILFKDSDSFHILIRLSSESSNKITIYGSIFEDANFSKQFFNNLISEKELINRFDGKLFELNRTQFLTLIKIQDLYDYSILLDAKFSLINRENNPKEKKTYRVAIHKEDEKIWLEEFESMGKNVQPLRFPLLEELNPYRKFLHSLFRLFEGWWGEYDFIKVQINREQFLHLRRIGYIMYKIKNIKQHGLGFKSKFNDYLESLNVPF